MNKINIRENDIKMKQYLKGEKKLSKKVYGKHIYLYKWITKKYYQIR